LYRLGFHSKLYGTWSHCHTVQNNNIHVEGDTHADNQPLTRSAAVLHLLYRIYIIYRHVFQRYILHYVMLYYYCIPPITVALHYSAEYCRIFATYLLRYSGGIPKPIEFHFTPFCGSYLWVRYLSCQLYARRAIIREWNSNKHILYVRSPPKAFRAFSFLPSSRRSSICT